MGHKKKNAPGRDLHQQAYDRLTSMQAFGDSKYQDKMYDREHDTDIGSQKIYSHKTYKVYWEHTKYYLKWVKQNYPDCKTLEDAKAHTNEWLQMRADEGKSSRTISTEAAAINKLYGIRADDPNRFQCPQRRRSDITRSRGTAKRDAHFSVKNNEELINFCKGSGSRRGVLERMTGNDLYNRARVEKTLADARTDSDWELEEICEAALNTFPDQDYYILHRNDKGGKSRLAPIVGPSKDKIVDRMQHTGADEKVWQYVSSNCDVHGYRSDYATYLYKQYARPTESLKYQNRMKCADGKMRSELYVCRNDERKKRLDRRALGIVSQALGHNREDTAIASYIRNL